MKTLVIGRDSSCNIVLQNDFVSRKHAQISFLDNGQTTLKDLGSSNGTYVNGNRVNELNLKKGDVVKCGNILVDWQKYTPSLNQQQVSQASSVNAVSKQEIQRPIVNQVDKPVAPVSYQPSQDQSQTEYQTQQSQLQYGSQQNIQQNAPLPLQQQGYAQQNVIVIGKQKSVGTALLLAFFFGPLGLLYASVTGGVVMFFLGIILSIVTLGLGLFIVWPICIIWAVVAANNANKNMANSVQSYVRNN